MDFVETLLSDENFFKFSLKLREEFSLKTLENKRDFACSQKSDVEIKSNCALLNFHIKIAMLGVVLSLNIFRVYSETQTTFLGDPLTHKD